MITIQPRTFDILAARKNWQRRQDFKVFGPDRDETEDGHRPVSVDQCTRVYGGASKISTLHGITIVYTEAFEYLQHVPGSLRTSVDGTAWLWSIDGVTVLDRRGKVIAPALLGVRLPKGFSEIQYDFLDQLLQPSPRLEAAGHA